MKNKLMDLLIDKLLLKKRGVIESVGNLLKNKCQIEHTRYRSFSGLFTNLIAEIAAYNFRKSKPSIFAIKNNMKLLFD